MALGKQRVQAAAEHLSGLEMQQVHMDQPLGERLDREDAAGHGQVGQAPMAQRDADGQRGRRGRRHDPGAAVVREDLRRRTQTQALRGCRCNKHLPRPMSRP